MIRTSLVLISSKGEQSQLLTEGSGSAPATLELDSTLGVGSWIDLSREGSDEVACRQLKELLDEPSSSDSKKDKSKPNFKLVSRGMRAAGKKISKA